MIDVLWSLACVVIGLLITPLVWPQIDRGMRWLKIRRK
jgi:hypothetical protein